MYKLFEAKTEGREIQYVPVFDNEGNQVQGTRAHCCRVMERMKKRGSEKIQLRVYLGQQLIRRVW